MDMNDTLIMSVRCKECQKVGAISTAADKSDTGKLNALRASNWPKACQHCGMVAAVPCTEADYAHPQVAMEAEVAIRTLMRERRA